VIAAGQFDFNTGMPAYVPQVLGKDEPQVHQIHLAHVDAQGLLEISREKLLALNLEEMQKIQAYYQDPAVLKDRRKFGLNESTTDVELECLAQTWSEHCKHKIFNSKIDYYRWPDEKSHQFSIQNLHQRFNRQNPQGQR